MPPVEDNRSNVKADAERRLAALEEAVAGLGEEVRTRRLVVEGGSGQPRLVGELSRGTVELRLEGSAGGPGPRPAVVLFATPAGDTPAGHEAGLGPAVGLQLWAEGDAIAELDAWPGTGGRWAPHFHLELPEDGT